MTRTDRRMADALRPYEIHRHFQKYPAGSVLIEMGNTKVICAASIEDRVPFFLRGTGEGWIAAEYSLLPSATETRTQREAVRGKQSGRTQEIERLIGRSLRSVVDTKALGERARSSPSRTSSRPSASASATRASRYSTSATRRTRGPSSI